MGKIGTGERKRSDGSYEKRFFIKGMRYSVYGKTLTEVRRKAKEKESQVSAGIYQTNDKITLNQYFKEWIERKAATVKPSTIMTYNSVYRNNIKPTLGRYRVRDIERRQITNLLNKIARSNRTGAARSVMVVLTSLFSSAANDEIIAKNVSLGIPTPKNEKTPARETIHRELTEEELKIFFSLVKNSIYYNHFRFMLYTGVRVGECCGLQWQDIDWKRQIIHIWRTVTRDKDGKDILGKTTKTKNSRRDIPINQSIMEVLTNQWNLYRDTHETINLIDLVFPRTRGEIASNRYINSVIGAIIQKANKNGEEIARFSVHAFRDTFASRAIRAGMPPNTLKEILGHASLAMTMDLYAHVSKEDKIEAMEKLTAINLP